MPTPIVVKHIFTMCMEGCGPSQIANQLRADQVLTPTAYKEQREMPLDVLMNGKTA